MTVPSKRGAVEPPAHAVDGLGVDGQRFVRAAFNDFECSGVEIEILKLAAQSLDDVTNASERGDLKQARAAARQFLAALLRLGLPTWERTP